MKRTIKNFNGKEYVSICKGYGWRPVDCDVHDISYRYYVSLLNRTVNKEVKNPNIVRWYQDVVTIDDSLVSIDGYENFKKWFNEKFYEVPGERMELDKDLFCDLLRVKKHYSIDTINFLPHSINSLLTRRHNERGIDHNGNKLPCCVHERKNKNGKYKYYALVRFGKDDNGKDVRKLSKSYDTVEQAYQMAYIMKREAIFERAEKYKPYLPKEVYQALLQYEPEKY